MDANVIEKYGVYSRECANAMAETAQKKLHTDIAIGITGTTGNVDPNNADSVQEMCIRDRIIIPMTMPSVTICLFLTLTNCFKLFDQNLALTAGGPAKKTAMLAYDIYTTFYNKNG